MLLQDLLTRYPTLQTCKAEIEAAKDALIACFAAGGKALLCGNGGSCAACDHIAGELMKGFLLPRPLNDETKHAMKAQNPAIENEILQKLQRGLPAISLPSMTAPNTAFCNDSDPDLVYAQSVMALGRRHDVLIAISTSGNAKNVNVAAHVAKGLGIKVIALTGKHGGSLGEIADICIHAPERETFKVQELHLPIYHYLCAAIEHHFFA